MMNDDITNSSLTYERNWHDTEGNSEYSRCCLTRTETLGCRGSLWREVMDPEKGVMLLPAGLLPLFAWHDVDVSLAVLTYVLSFFEHNNASCPAVIMAR